ncbi:MAG: hypothetical protein KGK07_15685 [Chloroflexota bacterium]|nr:hypothetical protein [Chloroflexota bacterium]
MTEQAYTAHDHGGLRHEHFVREGDGHDHRPTVGVPPHRRTARYPACPARIEADGVALVCARPVAGGVPHSRHEARGTWGGVPVTVQWEQPTEGA